MARIQYLTNVPRLQQGFSRAAIGLSMSFWLTGCMTGPDFVPPANEALPSSFSRPDLMKPSAQQVDPASQDAALQADIMRWWEVFDDPVLNQIMATAIQNNWDVLIATQRIEEARARAVNVRGQLMPQASLQPSAARQQGGTTNILTGFGIYNTIALPLNATWEPDLFGQIRRSAESQAARVRAAEESRRNVLVALTAELAGYYSNLRMLQAQISYTEKAIEASQRRLALTRTLLKRGLDSNLSLAQFEQAHEQQQSLLPPLKAQRDWMMYQCAFLTGGFPLDLQAALENPAPLLISRKPLPSALPSQVLRNRPDIREAEQVLAASTANIGVAEAAFMPNFSIPIGTGYNTTPIGMLLNPASFIWNVAVNMTQPLFTGGRLQAGLALANATREADRLAYERAVRLAVMDVEKALTGYDNHHKQRITLQDTVSAQQQVFANNQRLYKVGIQPEFQYLQSVITLNDNRINLAHAQNQEAVQLISLYKAIGGGWQWEASSTRSPFDDGMTTSGTLQQIINDNFGTARAKAAQN